MAKEFTEKQESNDKSLSGKKIVIRAIDKDEQQIVEYDQKGATLVFDSVSDEFPVLKEETLRKLSKWNADRYRVSLEIWEETHKKDPLREVLDGIEFGPNRGSATDRLRIHGRNQNYVYWWETPERVYDKMAKGWEVVQGSGEKTIHSDGSRVHRIGKRGEEELVLMRLPKKQWMKVQAAKVEQYMKGVRGLGGSTASSVGANPKDVLEPDQLEKLVASGKVTFKTIEDAAQKDES